MRVRALVVLVVLLSSVSMPVRATTVVAPTLRQMVDRADRIFVGEVVSLRSYRADGAIFTDVTFRLSEAVKGGDSPLVMLTFLGGTVGEDTLEIDGVPTFAIGDEQVVFATRALRQVSPIVGMWHGRVRVSRDRRSGAARVLRYDGTPFERATAVTERPAETSATLVMPMRLDAFLNEVRQLVRQGAAQ